MSSSQFDSVWKILTENSLEIDPYSIGDDLRCTLCKNIIIDACQAPCGCLFCYKCMSKYLRDGNQYCPGGKSKCTNEKLILEIDILKNDIINQKISQLKGKCKDCVTKIELMQFNDHSQWCLKQPKRSTFTSTECSRRNTGGSKLVLYNEEDPFNKSLSMIELIEILKNEINSLKEKTNINECELTNMKDKLKENEGDISTLRKEIWCMMYEMKEKDARLKLLEETLELKNEKENTSINEVMEKGLESENIENQEIDVTDNKTEKTIELINGIESKMNILEIKETELREKIRKAGISHYLWKINNFSNRRSIPYFGRNFDICSDYFYSHPQGYRLRLWLYPNKHKSEHYLTLFFKLSPGMFDGILEWPCKSTITLAIIDQKNKTDHFQFTVNYDTVANQYKYVFERPWKRENEGFGYDIKVDDLLNLPSLVVKNTIFVKCSVEPNNIDF